MKINMISDLCELEVDMRIPIGLSSSKVMEFIKEVLRKYGGELEIILSSEPNYSSPECEIVKSLRKVISETLGLDARGIPAAHYGPGELETIHGYNERVKVEESVNAARVYAGIISEYVLLLR